MDRVLNPVFQPIINLSSNEITYYEALARVANDDGNGNHIKLIEMGEAFGFIDLIDIAMLKHAIAALECNPTVKIAVNVSVMTIEKALGDLLSLIFKHYECIGRIVFEITETIEIKDQEKMRRFVEEVRLLKAGIAIDDFGDGYATMEVVSDIRPDFVKLPSRYVKEFAENRNIAGLQALKRNIALHGAALIAEHIDSYHKYDLLKKAGVTHGQGFYFGRYVDEDQLSSTKLIHLQQDGIVNILTA